MAALRKVIMANPINKEVLAEFNELLTNHSVGTLIATILESMTDLTYEAAFIANGRRAFTSKDQNDMRDSFLRAAKALPPTWQAPVTITAKPIPPGDTL